MIKIKVLLKIVDLPKKTKEKIKKRDKKRKPKMRISGKRVFQLKKIFKKK
jgi:hypothetical protein